MIGIRINSTKSLKTSAKDAIKVIESLIEKPQEIPPGEVQEIAEDVSNDGRLIHSLTIKTIESGKDITVQLDHAAGDVKRIVVNGDISLGKLISHLRSFVARV